MTAPLVLEAPTPVASNRYGVHRSNRPLWVVVHTSESPAGETGARRLAAFLARPGTRDNGRGGTYGSSYHYIAGTSTAIPAVAENVVAYSAAGGNRHGVHVVIPGYAATERHEWLDSWGMWLCARLVAEIASANEIPLERLTVPEVRDYRPGVCAHDDISKAFGRSSHWDPGPEFPWREFLNHAAEHQAHDHPIWRPPVRTRAGTERLWYGGRELYDSRPSGDVLPAGVTRPIDLVDPVPQWATVKVTAIGQGERGHVRVAGDPGELKSIDAIANVGPVDEIDSEGIELWAPSGRVWIRSTVPVHVKVALYGVTPAVEVE